MGNSGLGMSSERGRIRVPLEGPPLRRSKAWISACEHPSSTLGSYMSRTAFEVEGAGITSDWQQVNAARVPPQQHVHLALGLATSESRTRRREAAVVVDSGTCSSCQV